MKMKTKQSFWAFARGCVIAGLLSAQSASAMTACIFDPMGTQGPAFAAMKDYQLAAMKWGVRNMELKPFTDESAAVEAFKANSCDLINMTGLRARNGFNLFTGTIDSPGAIEDYMQLRELMGLMATPKVQKYMQSGSYEVVGFIPLGPGYIFVRDRKLKTLAQAVGKRVAVMDWDNTQAKLVQQVGAVPVPSDLNDFGKKFNEGSVDAIIAPILMYKPFELAKGLSHGGGIIRRPVIELTMQVLTRRDKFPAEFGEQSRAYFYTQLDRAFGSIHNIENEVDQHFWMHVMTSERDEYYKTMRDARVKLAGEGLYDKKMLAILKRIRCKYNPQDLECSQTLE